MGLQHLLVAVALPSVNAGPRRVISVIPLRGERPMKKKSTVKAARRTTRGSKRELIDTGTDKRFVRRDAKGRFNESDDVGRSLSADRRRKAKKAAKSGHGDKGDKKTRK
jgi:hypothetical protein